MDFSLSERMRRVLEDVIEDYILTAEPVGSRTISKKSNLNLSPATIRNIMSDLEELGLLSQPYTSAGRVPTEKGLRFYVDFIIDVHELSGEEQQEIRSKYLGHLIEGPDLFQGDFSNPIFILSLFRNCLDAPDELGRASTY